MQLLIILQAIAVDAGFLGGTKLLYKICHPQMIFTTFKAYEFRNLQAFEF